MKKISKLITALLLSFQAFSSLPINVLAEEQPQKESIEQVEKHAEENEATKTTGTSETSSTTESSMSSSESSTSSSSSTKESSTSTSTTSSSETITTSSSQTIASSEEPKADDPAPQTTEPTNEPQVETPAPKTEVAAAAAAPIERLVPDSHVIADGSIHFEKNESVESFIRKIGEPARKIGQEKDLYASVMIAQAILESASGSSELAQAPNYNLFGIKGTHNGKSVSFATQEDLGNGNLYATQAGFRVYENYEDCFNDYATLLKEGLTGNSHFYQGVWKENAKTYQEATDYLTGRYATDTQYNQKLNGLIETYELTEYDKAVEGVEISATGFAVPVKNYAISSPFGLRGGEFHRGLDMAAAQGEPIYASKSGTVLKAEYHYSWGNYVVIEHNGGMTTLYAHQSEYLVKPGDQVEQGQLIGYVGSTGNSTGSHLHLEMCQDTSLSQSKLLDPHKVLFGN
ncbi:peptidoglycan DD-metalloendopeptidase family protein [Enterococcus pallens]|uniref:Mannosyl-glycoprotein endo-beta-N-acetylglucosamidase-like domain-containing protein n=1 Tax=Enterococcus pallens ATCC BAA-351 TaxID=1158607 RepID=R2RSS4_9ENTE|nr:peptidoglycan DD-metalloendopeptidase family protein [Enterococcus pallens]EOH86405.1 hypothetical protein UAU_05207 [Enterococcus pallens ATCC BAA-351]EOU09386.1 hypothetical protein I588_05232 [Enterococcus pallens ATCC BAA-351]